MEKNEALFWKKKEFISFLLSIFVLFIHSYFAQNNGDNSLIAIINHKTSYFFSRSITQFAVPMFFILSGISFFKGYNNKKYPQKIKSRIFSLIIPYLLWNTLWMLWEIFCSYSFMANFSASEAFPLTASSILKGIFFYGAYPPFWFIFDLIVFTVAAPLVFAIICNKYVGWGSVVLLSVLAAFKIQLPESVFYYPTAVIFFIIGGLVGYHHFDFACKKSSKGVQIASVVVLSLYILAKNIVPKELFVENSLVQIIVFVMASIALWNLTDAFVEKLKPRAIFKRSFAIYAMHLNVAGIVLKILSVCLPGSQWLEIPKFVIMVVVTLVIINLVCSFLEKFLPKVYGILMGNRIK